MNQIIVKPKEWGTANTSTAVLHQNGKLEVHTGKVNSMCDANDVKSMSIATLENLCTLQEKRSAHQLAPSGLSESVISFISLVLDGIAGTTEISRLNSEDAELKRCVSEELGCLNTFLGNRLKIASHLTMNSAHAVVKKLATEKQNEKKSAAESAPESIA
jgi:hypothetical protein